MTSDSSAVGEPKRTVAVAARTPSERRKNAVQWVVIIIVALVIAALVKSFIIEAFTIPSGSMETTIDIGNRVLVDKLSYDFGRHPHVGDIVVFHKPADFYDEGVSVTDLIKRVVGLPGQDLRTGPRGSILVDGRPLSQPWLDAKARTFAGPAICSQDRTDCVGQTLHIPAGQYLVLGDNRDNSDDGRFFGPIAGHLLIGRAFVRIWPLSRFHWF